MCVVILYLVLLESTSRSPTTIFSDFKRRLCAALAVVSTTPVDAVPLSVTLYMQTGCSPSSPQSIQLPAFVCISCEGVTVSTNLQCGLCGGTTVQRLPDTGHSDTAADTRTAERSLCLPPGSLRGISRVYLSSILRLLVEWVTVLLPFCHRVSRGAAYSPPIIIDGDVVVWIVESPQWLPSVTWDSGMAIYYERGTSENVLVGCVISDFFLGLRSSIFVSGQCCPRCLRPCAASLQVIGHPPRWDLSHPVCMYSSQFRLPNHAIIGCALGHRI